MRMVSARMERTAGTSLLKTEDWYMMVSRDEEHMMLPPSASISEVICSALRFLVLCDKRIEKRRAGHDVSVSGRKEGWSRWRGRVDGRDGLP